MLCLSTECCSNRQLIWQLLVDVASRSRTCLRSSPRSENSSDHTDLHIWTDSLRLGHTYRQIQRTHARLCSPGSSPNNDLTTDNSAFLPMLLRILFCTADTYVPRISQKRCHISLRNEKLVDCSFQQKET